MCCCKLARKQCAAIPLRSVHLRSVHCQKTQDIFHLLWAVYIYMCRSHGLGFRNQLCRDQHGVLFDSMGFTDSFTGKMHSSLATHACMHTWIHAHTHTHTHTSCTHAHELTHTYIHAHTRTHAHTHTDTHTTKGYSYIQNNMHQERSESAWEPRIMQTKSDQ